MLTNISKLLKSNLVKKQLVTLSGGRFSIHENFSTTKKIWSNNPKKNENQDRPSHKDNPSYRTKESTFHSLKKTPIKETQHDIQSTQTICLKIDEILTNLDGNTSILEIEEKILKVLHSEVNYRLVPGAIEYKTENLQLISKQNNSLFQQIINLLCCYGLCAQTFSGTINWKEWKLENIHDSLSYFGQTPEFSHEKIQELNKLLKDNPRREFVELQMICSLNNNLRRSQPHSNVDSIQQVFNNDQFNLLLIKPNETNKEDADHKNQKVIGILLNHIENIVKDQKIESHAESLRDFLRLIYHESDNIIFENQRNPVFMQKLIETLQSYTKSSFLSNNDPLLLMLVLERLKFSIVNTLSFKSLEHNLKFVYMLKEILANSQLEQKANLTALKDDLIEQKILSSFERETLSTADIQQLEGLIRSMSKNMLGSRYFYNGIEKIIGTNLYDKIPLQSKIQLATSFVRASAGRTFIHKVLEEVSTQEVFLNTQDKIQIIFMMAHSNIVYTSIYEKFESDLSDHVSRLTKVDDMVLLLYSLAKIGITANELTNNLMTKIETNPLSSIHPKKLVPMIWGFLLMDRNSKLLEEAVLSIYSGISKLDKASLLHFSECFFGMKAIQHPLFSKLPKDFEKKLLQELKKNGIIDNHPDSQRSKSTKAVNMNLVKYLKNSYQDVQENIWHNGFFFDIFIPELRLYVLLLDRFSQSQDSNKLLGTWEWKRRVLKSAKSIENHNFAMLEQTDVNTILNESINFPDYCSTKYV